MVYVSIFMGKVLRKRRQRECGTFFVSLCLGSAFSPVCTKLNEEQREENHTSCSHVTSIDFHHRVSLAAMMLTNTHSIGLIPQLGWFHDDFFLAQAEAGWKAVCSNERRYTTFTSG
jgi:hypothetical protein